MCVVFAVFRKENDVTEPVMKDYIEKNYQVRFKDRTDNEGIFQADECVR